MAKSVFREKAVQPDVDLVHSVLNGAKPLWDNFLAAAFSTCPQVTGEWKFYGVGWGWCRVLSVKKKKLVYMTPAEGRFMCSFSFNDKGREQALQAGLGAEVIAGIEEGKLNPAGHTFDIPVASSTDFELAKQLLGIKAATM